MSAAHPHYRADLTGDGLALPSYYLATALDFIARARHLLAERIVERGRADPADVWLARQMAIADARAKRLATYARHRTWPLPCRCGRHAKPVYWQWRGLELVDVWCHRTWRSTAPVDPPLPQCCVLADDDEASGRLAVWTAEAEEAHVRATVARLREAGVML